MSSYILKTLAIVACATLATVSALPTTDIPLLSARDFKQCPAIDNTIYTSASGRSQWRLLCNRDTKSDAGHAVVKLQTEDLEGCIKACGSRDEWCHYAVFDTKDVNARGTCYLKSEEAGPVNPTNSRPGYRVAVKLDD